MASLVEVAEFVEEILRLDVDTPVKGFDGSEIGPANEQAQALANRTTWLKAQTDKLATALEEIGDKEYIISVNGKTGIVTLLYSDVGAAAAVHTHKTSEIETSDDAGFVTAAEKAEWSGKQDTLVSAETLKTIAGYTLLGEGNIIIKSSDIVVTSDGKFVTDAEKAEWSGKQNKIVSGTDIKTLHGNSLVGSGDVKLTYKNVGADKEGTAVDVVANHTAAPDPHQQYLNMDRAEESFVALSTANKANGYLQLDDTGNIPVELGELFQVRYIIANNEAERLEVDSSANITICLQVDENVIYYLDAEKDPSDNANWKLGKSTEVSDVYSVFGRSGIIVAQKYDYDADQIKETEDHTFVSADDRKKWNAKQNTLESGKDIKTINSESLLGASNIIISPRTIGAAEATHKHSADDITPTTDKQFVSASDITNWNGKQDKLKSGTDIKTLNDQSLLGNGNIELTYSDVGAAAKDHTHLLSDLQTTEGASLVTAEEKRTWNAKQETLVSGTNIKTLNYINLLGRGNVTLTTEDIVTTSKAEFVSKDQKLTWSAKQDKLVDGRDVKHLNGYSLLGSGSLDLTAKDVKADPSGTGATEAAAAVKNHTSEADPHTQYLNETRANKLYVGFTTANKPNGYLQLDSNGYIPAELGELFQSRYVTVDNKEERLALDQIGDITICLQADDNRVYYLNPELDPKEDDNWKKGRDVSSTGVVSVFGRGGVVTAADGDYTTEQITETDEKTFVSDTDRTNWDGKQDLLVSGTGIKTINKVPVLGAGDISITPETIKAAEEEHTHSPDDIKTTKEKQFVSSDDITNWNSKQDSLTSGTTIRTVNKQSILGEGNIEITPDGIGAASKEHTHDPDEINTGDDAQFVSSSEKLAWNAKQAALVSGKTIATVFGKDLLKNTDIDIKDAENLAEAVNGVLKAGKGTEIKIDETDGLITIGRSQGAIDDDEPTVIEINDVIGGRGYRYRLEGITFNSNFKVFKKVPIFEKRTLTIDYDNPDVPLVINELPENDELGYYPNGKPDISIPLSGVSFVVEKYSSGELTTDIVDPTTEATTILCENTLENVLPIYTADGTKDGFTPFANSTYGEFYPWKAFQAQLGDGETAPVGNKNAWSANEYWNNRAAETFLGIKNTALVKVTGYGLQNFTSFYWGSNSSIPTAWDFQGRNEDSEDWTTLDSQTDQTIMNGKTGWTTYRLDKAYMFKQYRLLVNAVDGTGRTAIPRFAICNDVGMLIKDKDGRYLASDDYGDYSVVSISNANDFRTHCFNTPRKPFPKSLFEYIAPVKVCTLKNIPITVKQCAVVPAIAIQNPLYPQTFWDGLQDINPTEYYSRNSDKEINIAVTVDGVNYYIYGDDGWTAVSQYTNDEASAKALIEEGMDGETFLNITTEQWSELLGLVDEPSIGIAYARAIVAKDMPITPKKVEANFEEVTGWEVMSFDRVNIRFNNEFIIFNPADDGDYKFTYIFK